MEQGVVEITGALNLGVALRDMERLEAEIAKVRDRVSDVLLAIQDLRAESEASHQAESEQSAYVEQLLSMLDKRTDAAIFEVFLKRPAKRLIALRRMIQSEADTEILEAEVLSVLDELSIKPVPIECGETFDASLQHVVDVVEVAELSRNGRIIEIVSTGYSRNGELISPAEVRVGRFSPPKEDGDETSCVNRHGNDLVRSLGGGSSDRATDACRKHRREAVDPYRHLVSPI